MYRSVAWLAVTIGSKTMEMNSSNESSDSLEIDIVQSWFPLNPSPSKRDRETERGLEGFFFLYMGYLFLVHNREVSPFLRTLSVIFPSHLFGRLSLARMS